MTLQMFPAFCYLNQFGLSTIPDSISRFKRGVGSLFLSRNFLSAVFALLTVVNFIYAAISIVNPIALSYFMWNAERDLSSQFLIRTLGGSTFMSSILSFSFKRAADEGQLGQTTFNHLSLAALISALAMIVSTLYVAWPFHSAAITAGKSAQLLTAEGWAVTLVIQGTLAILSATSYFQKQTSN